MQWRPSIYVYILVYCGIRIILCITYHVSYYLIRVKDKTKKYVDIFCLCITIVVLYNVTCV